MDTGAGQIEVVNAVLAELRKTQHVKPTVFTDSELAFVSERDAEGVAVYRESLQKALVGQAVQSIPHEQIIGKLDEAGKTFHILLLKTKLTIPYTSVFVQLDCGYWNGPAEERLRAAIKAAGR